MQKLIPSLVRLCKLMGKSLILTPLRLQLSPLIS